MAQYDAEVRVQTKVDTKEFEKLTREETKAMQELDKLIAKEKELNYQLNKGTLTSKQKRKVNEQLELLGYRKGEVKNRLNEASARLAKFNAQHGLEGLSTEEAKEKLKGITEETKKADHFMGSFGKRVVGLAKRVFVFSIIARFFRSIVTSLKDGIHNLSQFSTTLNSSLSSMKSSTETMKNSLATAFEPLINVLAKAVSKLADGITWLTTKASELSAALRGDTSFTKAKKQVIDYAESVKKARNSLADFDELHVINSGDGTLLGKDAFETVEVSKDLADSLKPINEQLEKIKGTYSDLWDEVKPSMGELATFYLEVVEPLKKGLAEDLTGGLSDLASNIERIKNSINPDSLEKIKQVVLVLSKNAVNGLLMLSDILFGILDTLGEIIAGLTQFADGWTTLIDGITSRDLSKIGDGFKQMAAGILNAVGNLLVGILNTVISAINGIGMDLPEFLGGGHIGFDIPKIPKVQVAFAEGGLVNRPTNALIGEAGAEAVLPLEQNTEWMDILADKLSQKVVFEVQGDPDGIFRVWQKGSMNATYMTGRGY